MNKIILFNPRSAQFKYRIPNSILNIAASVDGKFEWVIIDGNVESKPMDTMDRYLQTGNFKYLGFTVMPGPQLREAIRLSKLIKEKYPQTFMIWGGYFPSNHPKTVLQSGYVDFIINGPGDRAFPLLIESLERHREIKTIKNLIYLENGEIIKTPKEELLDQEALAPLPYDRLDQFYPIEKYLGKSHLGTKTLAYHSSIGCPFTCSFCAVVPIYEGRWKAKSALKVYQDVKYIKDKWGANAIEFHDNNFFVSEKRAVEFAKLILPEKMQWWGEARIDTMEKYSDTSLETIRKSGCRMIFFGAESGNDSILKQMDKGGTQNGEQIIRFAARLKKLDIIPEYSFVLGTPAESPEKVLSQINFELEFIKKVKKVNPKTEIVIYTYSPVPTEDSNLYQEVLKSGFKFPEKLEDWISPEWENFDLRKNPLTPWLKPHMINRIRNFETVLNGFYPTNTDIRLNSTKKYILNKIASIRYHTNLYHFPYEIKLLQKLWKYRQPEIQGF
jgi:radical SAM superfamily enzyme YgiQ (UPF0313 family)